MYNFSPMKKSTETKILVVMIYSILIKLICLLCLLVFFVGCITKERTQIQQTFNYMKLDLVTVRSFKKIRNNWFWHADLQLSKSHSKGKHFLIN
jgi:hypothetical protein